MASSSRTPRAGVPEAPPWQALGHTQVRTAQPREGAGRPRTEPHAPGPRRGHNGRRGDAGRPLQCRQCLGCPAAGRARSVVPAASLPPACPPGSLPARVPGARVATARLGRVAAAPAPPAPVSPPPRAASQSPGAPARPTAELTARGTGRPCPLRGEAPCPLGGEAGVGVGEGLRARLSSGARRTRAGDPGAASSVSSMSPAVLGVPFPEGPGQPWAGPGLCPPREVALPGCHLQEAPWAGQRAAL